MEELTPETELPINTPMWIKCTKYKGVLLAETDDNKDFWVFVSAMWTNPYSQIERKSITHYQLIKKPKP